MTLDCQYPDLSAATGYRYGCRCARCQARTFPSPECQHDGCTAPRQKRGTYCVEHQPVRQSKRQEAACELCGRIHSWYETQLSAGSSERIREFYRRVCGQCRQRYIRVIRHHHLDTEWALRLITAEHCDLCGLRFAIAANGRRNVHVDHDHACCPGEASCGACIRGLLCPRCNHVIASLEGVRDVGIQEALRYLEQSDEERQRKFDEELAEWAF